MSVETQLVAVRLPLLPRWLRCTAVLTVAVVILYYSVVPAPGSNTLLTGPFGVIAYSNWLHMFAYGGLAMSLAYAFHHSSRPEWQILLAVGIVTVGYGVSIELLQSGLVERTFAVGDMLVNAVGAVVAVAAWRGLNRYVQFYRARRVGDFEVPFQS